MHTSLQRRNDTVSLLHWLLVGMLLLVVGVALFPYGLVPFDRILSFSPDLMDSFYWLSNTWQAHVVGHSAIFMVMGTAVLLRFPSLLNRPKFYFGLMLVLGVLQEFFQIVGFKHRAIVFDDIFDVCVDLTGALLVFLLLSLVKKIAASSAVKKDYEVMS